MNQDSSMQFDPGLLELFQAEMDAHIPILNEGLLALEKGTAGTAQIDAMMRAAHSIKGAARIVGIEPAVRVAHVMEDCFTAAKESRISLGSDSVDVLLQGVDALQRICAPREDSGMTEAALQSLLEAIGCVRNDNRPKPPSKADSPPAVMTHREPAAHEDLIAATLSGDEPSVTLPAFLNETSAQALRKQLLDTIALRPERIQLDFTHVEQLTASMLAVLASFAREAARNHVAPRVISNGVSPPVQAVLRLSGLSGDFGLK